MEVEAEVRAAGVAVLDFRSLPLEGKKKKRVNTSDMLQQRDDALSVNHSVSL